MNCTQRWIVGACLALVLLPDQGLAQVELLSRDDNGQVGSTFSETAFISANGRWVVFQSSFLVPEDTTGGQIYIVDRETGIPELVSQRPDGDSPDATALLPFAQGAHAVSFAGRYVIFSSAATDIVPGANPDGRRHIFLRDRELGVTTIVSVNDQGDVANMGTSASVFSLAPTPFATDDVWLGFESISTNLDPLDPDGFPNYYLHTTGTGQTRLACFDSTGAKIDNCKPVLACNAGAIAFRTSWSQVVPGDADSRPDIFVGPPLLNPGVYEQMTISVDDQSSDTFNMGDPAISCDGRRVAFFTDFSILNTMADPADTEDLYVRDVVSGEIWRITSTGWHGTLTPGDPIGFAVPSFSPNGSWLVIETPTALDPLDTDNNNDIYLSDFTTQFPGPPTLVSRTATETANNLARRSRASDLGSVVFDSRATNLAADDFNAVEDVFASAPQAFFVDSFESGDTSTWQ